MRERTPTEEWMELPPSLTSLGGSDPDTVSGLAGGKRVGEGKASVWQPVGTGGTVPLPTLRLGRETAPRREGQTKASVRSDLNLCSQRWLEGVILCTPRNRSAYSHLEVAASQQGPHAHSRAGAAGGGCKNHFTLARGQFHSHLFPVKPRGC